MDMFGQTQSVDSTDSDRSSCTTSRSVLSQDHIRKTLWNKIFLEKPTIPSSGESRYLTKLWVSRNEGPQEELYRAVNLVPHHRIIEEKIRIVLKLLSFREQHVLVQFWLAHVAGKHQLLTTSDQPFGVGVATEELCSYRRDSEQIVYLVDKDHAEEDISPPARVFRRGLPEWTSDLNNYKPKDFPQQDTAIRCNLHGYLSLPVFDSTTSLCIGVIELLMSSKITDFAFEVQQVHKALKPHLIIPHVILVILQTQSLTSPQVSDFTTPNAPNEQRLIELDIVHGILKSVCDSHNLPLAQTWAVSPSTSFVSHDNIIDKTCSSFSTKCIGKVCMSTASLPFYVRDLRVWPFREACKTQHLDKSRSFVGKALLARGTSYCKDVTALSVEDYPLVHNACMSGLTSCFTVFLHSVVDDDEYVLEFFQQLDSKDGRHVSDLVLSDLVQTLKQRVEDVSGFKLGDTSATEFIGSNIQNSVTTRANSLVFETDSSDIESLLAIDTNYEVEATLERSFINLSPPFTSNFSSLTKEVVRRFNLEGKRLRMKYRDEANDWILITCDRDLELAFEERKSLSVRCEVD
ncbi:NIN-like protein [Artemisia annua]|uniref:NIN-like protein n=1 Tax=Artemisia annua TaxID=35608 RepID=A0A2U1PZF2_ARTAN|nr:NIN-like protein [Artemisia annua]